MTLKSPATYAEWFWGHGLEAALAEQESYEKELAPTVTGIVTGLHIREFLPETLVPFFDALESPSSPAWGSILGRFTSEVADAAISGPMRHATMDFNYKVAKWFSALHIDAPTASMLWQRKKIIELMYDERMNEAGYKPAEAAAFYESLRPYPTIPEIMLWARYHGDPYNIRTTVWDKFDVSADDFELWQWLGLQRLTTIQAQSLYKRGLLTEPNFYLELGRLGWSQDEHARIKDLAYMIPNAMLQVQGDLFQGMTDEVIKQDVIIADIHPAYASKYIDAVMTKPASQDIVAYQLRKDPELSQLPKELRRIGIHTDYHELYQELAYQIPPVADIITMAVREAFSPEIAVRFGQYEDFPPELAEWAGKKGLSKEWAERYWAAHWALPSSQQGFAMLHRGVITEGELHLLLRAQDVMPFWRDKLTQIAYRPLTRVDVRRMYKQGVLDEKEVYESYLDQGYAEENAERMAEFTVKQTLASLSKFTSGDIIKAFSSRMINSSEAMSLLRDIGIRSEDASYIISTAEYKRLWALTDAQIAGIRNLYKRRIYNENQARDKLARLNLPAEQINVLMEQWYFEKVEELDATWTTAQTIKFLKRKLISPERAERELTLIGYDPEHIDVYMKDLQWTQPKD